MNAARFYQNISDQIVEARLKVGPSHGDVRFFYPLSSVNAYLKESFEWLEDVRSALSRDPAPFPEPIIYDISQNRLSVTITPANTAYIEENCRPGAFLTDLIELFRNNRDVTLAEVNDLFAKHSSLYICEEIPDSDEFDVAIHFTDPSVDEYYYCFHEEMGMLTYHRFMKEDYLQLI